MSRPRFVNKCVCVCAPRWLQIPIASSVVFLGYLFGPGASEPDIWHDALEKCIGRVATSVASGVCPTLAFDLAAARAVPTLGYIAQLLPPPININKIEVHIGSRLLHAPGGSLSRSLMAAAPWLLSTRLVLPSALCWATWVRARLGTFRHLADLGAELIDHAEVSLPMAAQHRGESSPCFWRTSAIAVQWLRPRSLDRPPREVRAVLAAVAAGVAARDLGERKIQKFILDAWLKDRFPKHVQENDLRDRIGRHFDTPVANMIVSSWKTLVAKRKPHTLQCYVRSILYAWPTSERHHTDPRGCLLCDRGADAQSHYLGDCVPFRLALTSVWETVCPEVVSYVAWGAGVDIRILASAFSAYATLSRTSGGSPSRIREAFRSAVMLHDPG